MLLYIYYCFTFFVIIQGSYKVKHDKATITDDTIFSGVMQNITRVNDALQKLIYNYERLQKLYNSQEDETDSEVHEVSSKGTNKVTEFEQNNCSNGCDSSVSLNEKRASQETQNTSSKKKKNRNNKKKENDKAKSNTAKNLLRNNEEMTTPEIVFVDTHKIHQARIEIKKLLPKSDTKVRSAQRHNILRFRRSLSENLTSDFTKEDKHEDLNISEFSDDVAFDEALKKEEFKTEMLRKAYQDSCIKATVAKCKKACKETLKTVCEISKCKSGLKSSFKKTYTSECANKFKDTPALRRHNAHDTVNNSSTNSDALAELACAEIIAATSEYANATAKEDKKLNVLRSSLEKKCAKQSQKKCNSACKVSYEKTCKKYECNKHRKKNFKKYCKRNCKSAFMYKRGKKSKKSSSDSDSSDSDPVSSDYFYSSYLS